jgi:D-beta-D-heptose 7-phosphate kinase/D-beta-D-heptose 1-phosphate adenosyltransferase
MTDNTALAAAVSQLSRARILCVGDVMLDRFVYGDVARISPEAPIPVLRVERESAMLGGAGNVLRNLVALGSGGMFVSVVGDDAAGREVASLVGGLKGVEPHLLVARGRPTTIKTRYIAAGQQMLRADRETVDAVSDAIENDVLQLAATALGECQVVVISDYAKGALSAGATARIIAEARKAGRIVVVDPKGSDYSVYAGANVVKPNRHELAQASGLATGTDEDVERAARRLIRQFNIDAVVCTRGGDGLSVVRRSGPSAHLPALAGDVFDVSGGGDTVLAVIAACLAAGIDLTAAATLANVAGSIVVGKVGTGVVYPDDLVRALRHEALMTHERKIVSFAQAQDEVARWRRQGLSVGFTNGCFDILHPGHVSLIEQARRACDRLIVGLNSDASVRRLKGEGRPVHSEMARAAVLASLGGVDALVIFEDDTPLALIEALRPDVLVKGADYREDEVVGGDQVKSWGGRVVLAALAPGFSTTASIARIAR